MWAAGQGSSRSAAHDAQQGKAHPAACCADPRRRRQPNQPWSPPSSANSPVAGPPTEVALLAGCGCRRPALRAAAWPLLAHLPLRLESIELQRYTEARTRNNSCESEHAAEIGSHSRWGHRNL